MLVHAEKPPPSIWHWYEVPPSALWNVNVALVCLVGFDGVGASIVTVGADVSIVHVNATAAPVLPSVSVASTWNVCDVPVPPVRLAYVLPLVQLANAPPSIAHWNVALASVGLWNVKLALVAFVGFCGCVSIRTVGPWVSIVHVNATAAPVLPSVSVASTWNVCDVPAPPVRFVYVLPLAQLVNAPPSIAHENVALASLGLWNVKLALVDAVGFCGCVSIRTVAPCVSMVHVNATAAPVLPSVSVASTWNVCDVPAPPVRFVYVLPLAQLVKPPPSIAHENVALASLGLWNVKLALVAFVGFCGFVSITTVGPWVSIVHVYAAAAPVLPSVSVASTWNVCDVPAPPVRFVYVLPLAQLAKPPPSTAHENVALASVGLWNVNVALVDAVGFAGCVSITTVGPWVSMVHVNATAAPVLPSASVASTWNVCDVPAPPVRFVYVLPLAQLVKPPPSIAHENVALASLGLWNVKLALVAFVGFCGCVSITTVAPWVSIVHVSAAGAPVLPAASVALTWKVCDVPAPPVRLEYAWPLAQLVNAPPSIEHANDVPPSALWNANVALVEFVGFAGVGGSITTVGAWVSIVHVNDAGVPVLLASSVAWTWNVCDVPAPPVRLEYALPVAHDVNAPPSIEQANDVPPSGLWNVNVAEVALVGLAGVGASITTVGAWVSIVHVNAVPAPTLPAVSIARTWKLCEVPAPPVRLVYDTPGVHAA